MHVQLSPSFTAHRQLIGWDREWQIFQLMVASGLYTARQLAQMAVDAEHPIRLSHAIEERAAPGTEWEAIFEVLAG